MIFGFCGVFVCEGSDEEALEVSVFSERGMFVGTIGMAVIGGVRRGGGGGGSLHCQVSQSVSSSTCTKQTNLKK